MTKTAITGASGFIGSHLVKRLNDVLLLDHTDIVRGHSYNANKWFFLSTYGNMAYHNNHVAMVKANVDDVITVLNGFNGWFCFMSSSSVMLPVQTPYSRTKRAAEEILQALPALKSCIVRPYSVTGVGEQKEHLIPTLIRSCMEGEQIDFSPFPVHDFVDVGDIIDGLIALSESEATGIHEFGTTVSYSNEEVLDIVEHECGKKAKKKIVHNLREYDIPDWYCCSPSPYFTYSKVLQQSIEEMVEAYKREHA